MTTRQRSRNTGLAACRINPIPSVKYCQLFCLDSCNVALSTLPPSFLPRSPLPSPFVEKRQAPFVRPADFSSRRNEDSDLLSNSRSKEISTGFIVVNTTLFFCKNIHRGSQRTLLNFDG